jgi:hypothetical protein
MPSSCLTLVPLFGIAMPTRRTLLKIIPVAGTPLLFANASAQDAAPVLDEKDPQAVALGYVSDAKRVDKAKFPKYAPPQHCAVCQFYQGAGTAPMAPCTIFASKRVAGPGWCSAYVAKSA